MVLGRKQLKLLFFIVAAFIIAAMISNGILKHNRVIAYQSYITETSSKNQEYPFKQ